MKPLVNDRDADFMGLALEQAKRGLYSARPNPRVGCVLVKNGRVIGQGAHMKAGHPHAEIEALKDAQESVDGATCYVTLEPCCHVGRTGPCVQALIEAKIAKVVIANLDPNPLVAGQGLDQLQAQGIETHVGVMAQEAWGLNLGFFSRMKRKRPWVVLKIAMSLDGKMAMKNGHSQWITHEHSRAQVQALRAESCAVLTGAGTFCCDHPRLTVRDPKWVEVPGFSPPARVVVKGQRALGDALNTFCQAPGQVMIAQSEIASETQKGHGANREYLQVPSNAQGALDLKSLLEALAQKEMNQVLVEAGPKLSGAFIQEQLVDELIVFVAPKLLGNRTLNFTEGLELNTLAAHIPLTLHKWQNLEHDIQLTYGFPLGEEFRGRFECH